ncbi:hypothetical protein HPP92_026515 [Vanilla planifolia]|uniref:Uncharacterized protein n=1 Tax=Vanilla planifolia TaxID=51239 RepID=A0A835U6E5_VANPL|nr:hypothetical protein HPP92_026515 [Vanilla planifolia]
MLPLTNAAECGSVGYSPVGLQRQSSEGSFGESSLSGEYYIPTTLSSVTATMGPEGLNPVTTGGIEGGGRKGPTLLDLVRLRRAGRSRRRRPTNSSLP